MNAIYALALMGIIIAVTCMITSIVTTAIRARHGAHAPNGADGHATRLLTTENAQLKSMVCRLEERLCVVERIVTDAPARLTAEIERLG